MRVGFGSAHLDVPDGTPMGGYADRTAPSHGQHDPLRVDALTLTDRTGRTFALIVCDVVCVNTDLARTCTRALRHIGVAEAWIGATHTHSGPETGCVPGGADTPPDWLDRIRGTVLDAVTIALRTAAERTATLHPCVVPGVAGIRSAPYNVIDVPADTVAVRDQAGRLRGLLLVLPIHSTVLPATNLAVSADLLGGVRAHLEQASGVWTIVAAGAAGDISTRYGRRGQTIDEVHRLARLVGGTVRAALACDGIPLWGRDDRLHWTGRTLTGQPAPVDGEPPPGEGRPIELAAVRAGRLVLGAVPGEPFLATGQQFRADGPDHPVLLGYTNGYVGYLPTRDRFTVPGYEVSVSRFVPGTAERIVAALLDLATLTYADAPHR